MTFLSRIWTWLRGKKAIVGGALIVLAAVVGVAAGKVSPELGLGVVGVGVSAAGFADKLNRHQAEVLAALQGVAKAGEQYREGRTDLVLTTLEQTVTPLVPGVVIEAMQSALRDGKAITFSADDPPHAATSTGAPRV